MIIVTIRTDKPEAELGLYDDDKQLAYVTWQAHRQLATTLHQKLVDLLSEHGYSLKSVEGIVVYKGPGSYTGLRIGLAVANALVYSYRSVIIGTDGKSWQTEGIALLKNGKGGSIALPEYGAPALTSTPRK